MSDPVTESTDSSTNETAVWVKRMPVDLLDEIKRLMRDEGFNNPSNPDAIVYGCAQFLKLREKLTAAST